jgi:hypothetical protein
MWYQQAGWRPCIRSISVKHDAIESLMDFLVDFPWSLVAESWIRWYISITIDLWTLLPEWAYLPYSKWVQTIVICFYYCAIMMVSCFSASKTTQNKMTIGLMFRPCKAICFPLDPLCTKPCRILHHVGSYTYVNGVWADWWGGDSRIGDWCQKMNFLFAGRAKLACWK